jgi:peptidoglycan-associated lipoprotein
MTKRLKAFVCGLAIISAALIPAACRSTKKQTKTATTATDTAPQVAIVVPQPPVPTPVQTDTDFVSPKVEPEVTEAVLPTNLEDLNRVAQERGLIQDAFFDYAEAGLSSEAQTALTNSADWLKKNSQYNILIEGHCDERGTEQYNLALGDKRANTAKQFLQTLGVDSSRIRTVSYGEERPFNAGHDESSWSRNRRAHLVIVGR